MARPFLDIDWKKAEDRVDVIFLPEFIKIQNLSAKFIMINNQFGNSSSSLQVV